MRRLRFPRPETILRRLNREIRALEREHSAAARAARTPSDCPGCIALREQNRLLSDHSLHLLDQIRAITARVRLLVAANAEGFDFIGIEREAEYVEIARRRIANVAPLFAEPL